MAQNVNLTLKQASCYTSHEKVLGSVEASQATKTWSILANQKNFSDKNDKHIHQEIQTVNLSMLAWKIAKIAHFMIFCCNAQEGALKFLPFKGSLA